VEADNNLINQMKYRAFYLTLTYYEERVM